MQCLDCQQLPQSRSPHGHWRLIVLKIEFDSSDKPMARAKVYRCTVCRATWHVALAPRFRGDPVPGAVWSLATSGIDAGPWLRHL